ncbi:MAG TPA: PKD domain-containing protein [Bacteroidia bacterium]|nr:PKD domain-containing protein [Bacteroidia bacterium]
MVTHYPVHQTKGAKHPMIRSTHFRTTHAGILQLALFVALALPSNSNAQTAYCGAGVPTFTVNLTGQPNGNWISPNVQRVDTCCGVVAPDVCVQFIVTLDPQSTGIAFNVYSGAMPPGALFYQVDCGPPTPVGAPICLTSVGPHYISFCKPGNNNNEYIITSIGEPDVSNGLILNDGCSGIIACYNYDPASITWNSVFPGASGDYNSYLSCTAGCDSVTVTGTGAAPGYVDYQICGFPLGGCTSQMVCDTIRVYFNPTLAAAIVPANPTICYGNTGTWINANPTGGDGNYTYLWSNGATIDSIYAGVGSYTVTVSDGSNCPSVTATVTVTSFSVAITANAGPDIHACTSNPTVQLNGSVTGASGGFWNGGGGTFAPNNTTLNATYTPSPSEISNGQITLTLITTGNGTCPPGSDNVTIFIHQFQSTITTGTVPVNCAGQTNGSASSNVTGANAPFTFSWNTNPVQTGSSAFNLAAGTYVVTVTDVNGCTGTATATITQPQPLTVSTTTIPASCDNTCNGQAISLPSGGTQPYSFNWSSGCTSAGCNNLCAGSYTLTVTDNHGCVTTATAVVTEPAPLAATVSSVQSHCNNSDGSATVNISGGTPGYTYLWQPTGQTTPTNNNIPAGNYSVVITDANNCSMTVGASVTSIPGVSVSMNSSSNVTCPSACNGSATVLASGGNGPYNYNWSTSPAQTSATASNLCASTFTVVVTDADGCSDSASVLISQPLPLVLTAQTPPWICIGQSTTLAASASGGTPGYTYNWSAGSPSVSPSTTTTYSVTVTDANGCSSAIAPITVNVFPPLNVVASGGGTTCLGSTVTLTAQATGGNGGPYSYNWVNMGTTSQDLSVAPTTSGQYTVTASDGCTSQSAVANANVFVPTPPNVTLSTSSGEGCINMCSQFTSNAPAGSTFLWHFGDGGTSTASDPVHCYAQQGNYSVTLEVTDTNNCTYSFIAPGMVIVHANPVADFTLGPQPTTILEPLICFTDLSSPDVTSWYWNFGDPHDLTTDSTTNTCHVYADTGRYCVDLVVTNQYGCFNTVEYCLEIQPYYGIYVPNAFTPNGDGLNDNFLPSMYNIQEDTYELQIFDRWGNLIYKTDNVAQGWDGRVKNKTEIAMQDVYVWKINVKDFSGSAHQLIGHVTLIGGPEAKN